MRLWQIGFAILLTLISIAGAAGAEPSLRRISSSVVDPQALHLSGGTWGNCINGQSFQQEALMTSNGWQYTTYYDIQRRVCVARRPAGTPDWDVIRFGDYHFEGNDTHNVAVLGISPIDGTIHLAFDHHGDELHYRRSQAEVTHRPQEVEWHAKLFSPITNQLEPETTLQRVTYPRFVHSPQGWLQFGCRIGGSGNGDKCLVDYDATVSAWTAFGAFAGGQGTYQQSHERNAYLNGLTYDASGNLHVTWCWRETGDPMTNHDLNYAWSKDGGHTWLNNDGQQIGKRGSQPMTIDSPGVRVVEIGTNRGLMNTTTQAVDSRGRIHLVTFHLPDGEPQQIDWVSSRRRALYFHYWRDERGKWQRTQMNLMGGRPQVWFDQQDNAYIVYTGDRYHELPDLCVARASSDSGWTDWQIVHRETGPFTGQPQLDRFGESNQLSVYIQEQPQAPAETSSPLRVIDFQTDATAG